MKVREGALIKQEKVANVNVNKMKQEVQEGEQNTNTWEENRNRLDKVVSLSCTNFTDEGIKEEMVLESKVTQLGEIAEYLRKKVTKLETSIRVTTPP